MRVWEGTHSSELSYSFTYNHSDYFRYHLMSNQGRIKPSAAQYALGLNYLELRNLAPCPTFNDVSVVKHHCTERKCICLLLCSLLCTTTKKQTAWREQSNAPSNGVTCFSQWINFRTMRIYVDGRKYLVLYAKRRYLSWNWRYTWKLFMLWTLLP